jgi:hypothetical protein
VNDRLPLEHPHPALKDERSRVAGGDLDRDRDVERKVLRDLQLGEDDLGRARRVGRTAEDQRRGLAFFSSNELGVNPFSFASTLTDIEVPTEPLLVVVLVLALAVPSPDPLQLVQTRPASAASAANATNEKAGRA